MEHKTYTLYPKREARKVQSSRYPCIKKAFYEKSFWLDEFLAHLAVIHVWAAELSVCQTTWTTRKIKALHLRATGIQTTGEKSSDLLLTQIFWLCASSTGRTRCTYTAGLISLVCRCISLHEFLIRNRKASTPCLWIHSIPRQDTFQQGFPPDSRRSRLQYGFLVTQNKVQSCTEEGERYSFHIWGNWGKGGLPSLLCVSSWNQYLLIPAARFIYESVFYTRRKETSKVNLAYLKEQKYQKERRPEYRVSYATGPLLGSYIFKNSTQMAAWSFNSLARQATRQSAKKKKSHHSRWR